MSTTHAPFAQRMNSLQKSFIREILKVTENQHVISFAGGLPNPDFFPAAEMAEVTHELLQREGAQVLQYSTSEGYLPLREWIAQHYQQRDGLDIHADDILILNGSQQGLDLIGKVFLNPQDVALVERPGYLGAIQAFSFYQPRFVGVPLEQDGVDIAALKAGLAHNPKLFYTVPTFQNPSGITYSAEKRHRVAELLGDHPTILVEDDPYNELRFMGEDLLPLRYYRPNNTILLGSFSKMVAPGLRLGWLCAAKPILEKLIIAKQAADLHSNYLAQRVVHRYLQHYDLEAHLQKIRAAYGQQRRLMVSLIEQYFPPEVEYTRPEGGMFLWVTLPSHLSAMDLFELATKHQVAFVPGQAFYVDGGGHNTLRLNFSNASEAKIEEGIKRLAQAIKQLLHEQKNSVATV
ncbi:PLP-dependent aminotransferase family protein [Thioflexithrix psekupsensis]|uniref:Aspartate aminotransferase n=1 Tax=Thioflexithrix psekupsensis TaxID=1570016 RepID=A0A251X9J0_9GAMM|nr:PLP-dependent aminotransferase family protein [Thioflexithrix psekupsensis]OUD14605.1 aspartate aminotransferase [Thioflexithrix psekupsensis]